MARKPVAREAVLDAFESLLIEVGERAATLDAVARRAGVSKGGLLYHFPNKEAMISALLERMDRLVAEDVEIMANAPEGAAVHFIKSSLWADTPLDRVFVAATRLAEVAHEETLHRFAAVQGAWLGLLAGDVGPAMAKGRALHGRWTVFQCHARQRSRRLPARNERRRRQPPGRRRTPPRLSAATLPNTPFRPAAPEVRNAAPAWPPEFADASPA